MQKLKNTLACVLGLLMFCTAQAQPKIVRVEYYVDTDPGYGNAIKITGISGNNISNKTISVKIDTLKTGIHIMGIRALDSLGAWSLDNNWLFYKPDTAKKPVPDIVRIEYYIDKDPGYGKGIEVAIDNAKDYPNVNLFINISALQAGKMHMIGIRSRDRDGSWSLDNVDSFTGSTLVAAPSISAASISSKIICAGGQVKVGYQKQGTFNAGNIFSVQLSDSVGSFTNFTQIGSITDTTNNVINCAVPGGLHGINFKVRVVSTNPIITSVNAIDSIVINAQPGRPVIAADKSIINVCPKNTVTLTCTAVAALYKWNTGDTTQSIIVDTTGNYIVTVYNASNCSTASDTAKVIYQSCTIPTGAATSNITSTTVVLKWQQQPCAIKYKIQYRLLNDTFTTITTTKADTSYILTGLLSNTSYEWRVAAVCKKKPGLNSNYTKLVKFSTTASFALINDISAKTVSGLQANLFPNPTTDIAFISIKNATGKVSIIVSDINGKELWRTDKLSSNIISVPVKNLAAGNYLVSVSDDKNRVNLKLVRE